MREVAATNGLMLHLLTTSAQCRLLPPVEASVPQWERMLRYAVVDERASALIDAGALLASVSNAAAAERAVELLTSTAGLQSPLRGVGVVHFDGRGVEGTCTAPVKSLLVRLRCC